MEKMWNRMFFVLALLAFSVAAFVGVSSALMATWNYTIPRLITSIEGQHKFEDISFNTSLVFTLLIFIMFGGSTVSMATLYLLDRTESFVSNAEHTMSDADELTHSSKNHSSKNHSSRKKLMDSYSASPTTWP